VIKRWATGWMIGGFETRQRVGIFLFTSVSRSALGPTQPPMQCVPRALSLGVKRPGRKADHSPPYSTEVENAWSYTSTTSICHRGRGAQLKHRDNFTFYSRCTAGVMVSNSARNIDICSRFLVAACKDGSIWIESSSDGYCRLSKQNLKKLCNWRKPKV
jgi:hypothetical protein